MSAHIAIRCDECGTIRLGGPFDQFTTFRDMVANDGWESNYRMIDTCPFCVAKRKARERAEAENA